MDHSGSCGILSPLLCGFINAALIHVLLMIELGRLSLFFSSLKMVDQLNELPVYCMSSGDPTTHFHLREEKQFRLGLLVSRNKTI